MGKRTTNVPKYVNSIFLALFFTVSSFICSIASAETIRWNFTNTTFYDGTSVTGYFDYNTYSNAIEIFSITVEQGSTMWEVPVPGFTFDQTNSYMRGFQLYNNTPSYMLQINAKREINGATAIDHWLDVINWNTTIDLTSRGTYVFAPLNGNWGYENIRIYEDNYSSYNDTTRYLNAVTLTSNSVSAVPEPATILFLGSGLAGIAVLNRKLR